MNKDQWQCHDGWKSNPPQVSQSPIQGDEAVKLDSSSLHGQLGLRREWTLAHFTVDLGGADGQQLLPGEHWHHGMNLTPRC